MNLMEIYNNTIVYILYLVFMIFVVLLIFSFKEIKRKTIKISRKSLAILILIFIISLGLRLFILPISHKMYIDEPLYLDYAKNINLIKRPISCEYTSYNQKECFSIIKPPGWPFILSILFLLLGYNNYYAIYLNILIGSFSIILTFLLTYLIFKKEKIALFSSFLLAISPIHIIWSNSAETNIISNFFILFTTILFIIYKKSSNRKILILTIISLLLSVMMRLENFLLIFLFCLEYYIIKGIKPKPKIKKWLEENYNIILVALLLITFILMSISIESFGRTFFYNNFCLYLFDYIKATSYDYIMLIPIIIYFIIYRSKSFHKIRILLGLLLFSFIINLFLFFPEERFALTPLTFMIILGSYSLNKILQPINRKNKRKILIIIIPTLLIFLFLNINQKIDSSKLIRGLSLETSIPMRVKGTIPDSSYLILKYPSIITSVSDIKGISISNAISDDKIIWEILNSTAELYYLKDIFCYNKDNRINMGNYHLKDCIILEDKLELKKIKILKKGDINACLYQILGFSDKYNKKIS